MLCPQEPARMRAVFFCLCLCLLGTVLPTPVPPPARARGNCPGQHQILLKGCNTNHGFFVFKFMHSFMRRNQTQVKKEEGDHQGTIHGRWLGKADGETLGQGVGSSHVPEDKDSPKPHSHITPVSKVGGRALRPSTGDSISVYPTSTSMEGSGDMGSMLLGEIINGEDGLPQSTRPGEPHGDGNGGNGVTPGDGAVTAGRERATDSEGAGGEGSSHATVPDQGQAGTMVTGDSAITSVTKKEDVHVDAEDIGEFAYIPYVDAATITRGQDGETHVSPKDEVQIFIGRANIQVGENDGSAGSTGATSKANVIPAAVNARPQGYPEESASMATVHHGDSATSRPGDHPSAGNSGDGATANHSGQELEVPSPRESTDGEATVTTAAGSQSGKGRSGQRPVGKHSLPATMTTQGARGTASSGLTMGDCSTAASTPPEKGSQVATAGQEGSREVGTAGPKRQRARIQQEVAPAPDVEGGMVVPEGHGARTQPGVSSAPSTMETEAPERHRSRAQQGVAPVHSMERETVTPERQRARMQPGSARMQPGSARLGQAVRPEVAPAPSTAGGIVAPEGHRARVWPGAAPAPGVIRVARPAPSRVYNGDKRDAMGKSTDVPRDPWVWGSTSPQTQHTRGSMVAGSFSHLHGGQRMGSLAELERSRQVEQVRQADRLRLHERALYGLSGVGGPLQPLAAQADSWSADSSQSSEGQWGSRSNSGEEDGEVRGYPHRRRSF